MKKYAKQPVPLAFGLMAALSYYLDGSFKQSKIKSSQKDATANLTLQFEKDQDFHNMETVLVDYKEIYSDMVKIKWEMKPQELNIKIEAK